MGGFVPSERMAEFNFYMVMVYLICLGMALYAIFGFVRTAATRMPIPSGGRVDPGLMPFDITPKLYSYSPKRRKALKLVIFALIALLALACCLAVLGYTYSAGSELFGWGLVRVVDEGEKMVLGAHLLFLLMCAAAIGIRAKRRANRYPEMEQRQG